MPEGEHEFKDFDISNILVAEFDYIAQTAFQANEDRARASQFFFLTFATLIAALYSTQLNNVDYKQVYKAFAFIFLVLFVLGILTLLQLVRLRLAWLESIMAMNHIKEHITIDYPQMLGYFRWTMATTPPAFKFNSIGYVIALMVSLLSGIAVGSSIAFLSLSSGVTEIPWSLSVPVGAVCSIVILLLFYWLPLRNIKVTSIS